MKFSPAVRLTALALLSALTGTAHADGDSESWAVHGQMTNVTQWHPAINSPHAGENSLDPRARSAETTDLTAFLGVRPWAGAEIWINPEYDQGFGLSNTVGAAGFPSGEAYKVGANTPYLRVPRLFLRQTINLGGDSQRVEGAANQLAGSSTADNVVITVGKFSVVDVFDTNAYAHDPRGDFLNWSIVDAGAFDYAADAWGFTYGLTAEWTQSWWTLRGGVFDLSKNPNSTKLDPTFSQYSLVGEFEARHQLLGQPGKVKLLYFVNRGHMGDYRDAVRLAQQNGTTPDMNGIRHFGSRPGFAVNIEQQLAADLGVFAKLSANDGSKEAFEFTEINRSLAAGFALRGNRWGRADDTLGAAVVVNALSDAAKDYFAAGGIGILIGDGQLPHYGPEKIAELYYTFRPSKNFALTADYQHIVNPAYNRDRGPVPLVALRLHAEF